MCTNQSKNKFDVALSWLHVETGGVLPGILFAWHEQDPGFDYQICQTTMTTTGVHRPHKQHNFFFSFFFEILITFY
jgi:hypothetical protein